MQIVLITPSCVCETFQKPQGKNFLWFLYPLHYLSNGPPDSILPLPCSCMSQNRQERKTQVQLLFTAVMCTDISHWLCVWEKGKTKHNVTVCLCKHNLYRQELCDEREEDHLLAVPHLLAIDLNPTPQFPSLAAILHKDLWRNQIMFNHTSQVKF